MKSGEPARFKSLLPAITQCKRRGNGDCLRTRARYDLNLTLIEARKVGKDYHHRKERAV
jgi:hypothetical protein